MKKYLKVYLPFIEYVIAVAIGYMIVIYFLPKYNQGLLAEWGLGFLLLYEFVGSVCIGFSMGKYIFKRNIAMNLGPLPCFIYPIVSCGLMYVTNYLQALLCHFIYEEYTYNYIAMLDSLGDFESKFVVLGTLIAFSIGEFVGCIMHKQRVVVDDSKVKSDDTELQSK